MRHPRRTMLVPAMLFLFAGSLAIAQSNNSLLNGNYGFVTGGYSVTQNWPVGIGGVLVADGKGNITSGFVDVNDVSKPNLVNAAVTGTYNVVSNYRATISFTVTSTKVTYSFIASLAGISGGVATQASLIENDANEGTSGSMEKQDSAAFSIGANTGAYVVGLAARSAQPPNPETRTSAVGSFTLGSGSVTNGLVDIMAATGDTQLALVSAGTLTGGFSVAASGRGTMTLNAPSRTIHLAIYPVSTNRWLVFGTDAAIVWRGVVLRQTGAPFSLASCNGNSVLYGTDSGSATTGIATCDGAGNGTVTLEQNEQGTVDIVGGPMAVSLTSAANGRMVFNLGGGAMVAPLYFYAPNSYLLASQDALVITGEAQTGAPFTNASLKQTFGFGTIPAGGQVFNTGITLISGTQTFDGAGRATTTQETVKETASFTNNVGNTFTTRLVSSGVTSSDTYSVESNGRVTCGSCSTVKYIVSPSKVVAMEKGGVPAPTITLMQATGAPADVTPVSGWWWDPNLSGTGFFIEYGGKSLGGMFVGGFLYDASGNSTWLASTGPISGSTYTSTWSRVSGGQTLTGPYRAPSGIGAGNIVIVFSDSTHGLLTRPDGSKVNLQRFSFTGSTPTAPVAGAPQSGWWWAGSSLSGTGYGIEIQGSSVFIVAYVYDDTGNPVWYLATGGLTSPTAYSGTWDLYSGGPQLTSPEGTYSTTKVTGKSVAMSLTFSDGTHGTLTMGSVSIPIVRFQEF